MVERQTRVLVVDDDEGIRWALVSLLEAKGYAVRAVASAAEARREIERDAPEIAVVDVHLGDGDGIDVVRHLRAVAPQAAGVVVTGQATVRTAVRAIKEGAFDFVEKPITAERILPIIDRAERHARPRREAGGGLRGELLTLGQAPLLGHSAAMVSVKEQIRQVVGTKSTTALILGESGTGKELVARAIHHGSVRRQARFVAINCAAISESLLESELFGYEKGAFTGASGQGKVGLLEAANKGTTFLDELGEMPLPTQAKLLRVLQERTIKRVGGIEDVPIDVRVVASTNRDLSKEVREGRFRLDLYHRLNVFTIRMPPLRERPEDIELLAEVFLAEISRELEKALDGYSPDAMAALRCYRFPGNVRELRNIVEHAAIVAPGPLVERAHLALEPEGLPWAGGDTSTPAPGGSVHALSTAATPPQGSPTMPTASTLAAVTPPPAPAAPAYPTPPPIHATPAPAHPTPAHPTPAHATPPGGATPPGAITLALADEKIETAERELIARVLERAKGNRRRAAERLGINRSTLYAKLKAYGLGGDGATDTNPGEPAEG